MVDTFHQSALRTMAIRIVTALVSCTGLASFAAAQADLVAWGTQIIDTRWKSEDFVRVDAGEYHTLALRPDGTVVAWGSNLYGECEVPALPAGLTYSQVSAGFGSSALRSDGQIITWGPDYLGANAVPPPPPGPDYLYISTGNTHRAALRDDGQVVVWGFNDYFQCSVPPLPPGTTYVQVSAGYAHTVALRSDGEVVAWGGNFYGQASPPPLPPGKSVVAVEAGGHSSAVLYDDGSLDCWGANISGTLDVPALASGLTWVQISLGFVHSIGLVSDGTVRSWGSQGLEVHDVPSPPAGATYTQVSAGLSAFSVAMRSDQRYAAWGLSNASQTNAHDLPTSVEPVGVVVDGQLTFSIFSDGTVASLGTYFPPQLPDPPPGTKYVTVAHFLVSNGFVALRSDGQVLTLGFESAPSLPPGTHYTDVERGSQELCYALRSDGVIVGWGPDAGLPSAQVPGLPSGTAYTSLSCGTDHRIALRSDGKAISWGLNSYGQLNGPGLPPGEIYVEAEAGSGFSVARRSDGVVLQWGQGPGALPMLGSGQAFVDLELGLYHGLARLSDGRVVGWGEDDFGKSTAPSLDDGDWYSVVSADLDRSAAIRRSGSPCGGVVTYCGTPIVNSTGESARLQLVGCAGLTTNGLWAELSGLPPGQLGILIYATSVSAVPFGEGTLCLGGQVVRVLPPLVANGSGVASASLDLSQPPFSAGQGQVLPGSIWNFQFWYRDPAAGGAGFNLSDAAHVVFAP